MNLDELEKLADAATPGPWRASKEQWPKQVGCYPLDKPFSVAPERNAFNCAAAGDYETASYVAAANPAKIKRLIALVRMQHRALYTAELIISDEYPESQLDEFYDRKARHAAIAAYEQFEKGE